MLIKNEKIWVILRENGKSLVMLGRNGKILGYFRKKTGKFSEKGRLEGTIGKFCEFISEKGRLQGTSEIFEKNKVQREKWPVPSNGPPL